MGGLASSVGAVLLLLAIIYFNNHLPYRLDTKIDTVLTDSMADIESAPMELSADIPRLDDRLFAAVNPAAQQEASES